MKDELESQVKRKLIDRLYAKGFIVDVVGNHESDGFHPSHISVRTVGNRQFSIGTWRKIQHLIQLVLELDTKETTQE